MAKIEDPSCPLPHSARDVLLVMIGSVKELDERIHLLDREIAKRAREDETARRLMTIPGIGPSRRLSCSHWRPAGELRQGPRLCRVARAHTAATLDRRQVEARSHHQDGRANAAASADPGERGGRSSCQQARSDKRIVARADDGEKAAHAGDGRARQQDCAHRLGAACQRRSLSSSGRRGLIRGGREDVGR